MALDVSLDLIGATVELEQPIGAGMRTVGTGFLVSDPAPDGTPRVVLVTANHVFAKMKDDQATIGYRVQQADGSWKFAPQKFAIRAAGKELWRHHPSRDVAAIAITVPAAFARAAIPLNWLGGDDAIGRYQLQPGDEMMTLGFPQGLSANAAGFPILRSGRVASYPLGPSAAFPTFLLDFRVYPGNSGGPVYLSSAVQSRPTEVADDAHPVIAGMLTQQVEVGTENLQIGIVTQARFVRETLALLDSKASPPPAAGDPAGTPTSAAVPLTAYPGTALAADAAAGEPDERVPAK
ncbi:MAG: trypsin-like peptidase domain-containing protein [Caulobacteraceae bacterium]|nr:trypsin-like peptidase domain-containing protein [Caulobacteraceae bacterium]